MNEKKVFFEDEDYDVTEDTVTILTQAKIEESDQVIEETVENNEEIETKEEEANEQEDLSATKVDVSKLFNNLSDEVSDVAKDLGDKAKVEMNELSNSLGRRFTYMGMGILDYLEDVFGLFFDHNYQSELVYSNNNGHQIGYMIISHILMMIPIVTVCLGTKARHKIYFKNIEVLPDAFKLAGLLVVLLFGLKLVVGMLLKIYENAVNHHNYGYMRIIKVINIQEMIMIPFLIVGSICYALAAYFAPLVYIGLGLMGLGVIVSYEVFSKMLLRFKVMVEERLSYNILLPILLGAYYFASYFVVYKLFATLIDVVLKGLF